MAYGNMTFGLVSDDKETRYYVFAETWMDTNQNIIEPTEYALKHAKYYLSIDKAKEAILKSNYYGSYVTSIYAIKKKTWRHVGNYIVRNGRVVRADLVRGY